MAGDPDRAGIRRQHNAVHPAGFWAGFGRRFRGQRISASSHRRHALPHHLDDGSGRGRAPGRGFRSRHGVDRSGADHRLDAGFFRLRWRKASRFRSCCSAYASKRSQAGAVQWLSARGQEAGHGLCGGAATAAAELSFRACCGRSSTTISSFLPSARPSKRNWRI